VSEGYETIEIGREGRVATVTLARPEALNALSRQVMLEVTAALAELDADDGVGCIVVAGGEKAFAAGADIKEMMSQEFADMYLEDRVSGWDALEAIRKPLVAAVAGYALGGGCELAMMCDLVIAADTARFGQPEIKLGILPGIGGTQRLTRAIGPAKAMDLVLTGRMIGAAEAEAAGLVSRVVPAAELAAVAAETAATIAAMSLPAVMLAKEAVKLSQQSTLAEGVRAERRLFHAAFALADQKEGMAAFVEKREPKFTNR
jgi:enoyl-CoA hydratase